MRFFDTILDKWEKFTGQNGNFNTLDNDIFFEIAKGNVPGHEEKLVSGENLDLATSPQELWSGGGLLILPIVGEQWELVSSSGNDTNGGTGAHTVEVFYLDDNYVEQMETVTLNGGTVTMIATDLFRPIKMIVTAAGSLNTNDDDITMQVVVGGATRGRIIGGKGTSSQLSYTTPAGKTAYLFAAALSVGKNKDVVGTVVISLEGTNIIAEIGDMQVYQNTVSLVLNVPFRLPEKTDFRVQVVSTTNNTSVRGFSQLIVVDN